MNKRQIFISTNNELFFIGISKLLEKYNFSTVKILPGDITNYQLADQKINIIFYLERYGNFDIDLIWPLRKVARSIVFTHTQRVLPTPFFSDALFVDEKMERENIILQITRFINSNNEEVDAGSNLSEKEMHLLNATLLGMNMKEAADEMGIGLKSAYAFRRRGMKKIGCRSIADLFTSRITEPDMLKHKILYV